MSGAGGRLAGLMAVAVLAGVSACGGDGESASSPPPGSAGNPLVAHTQESDSDGARSNEADAGGAKEQPGYQDLVANQTSRPRSSFTPCNLVSAARAGEIVGAPMKPPFEAPQGPTCIYRSRDGRQFVTLAVQALDFGTVQPRLRGSREVEVADRTAYCGTYGQPMLYVPLSPGQVLSVSGPCALARRFASTAVDRLPS
jgi:hypothetical protein